MILVVVFAEAKVFVLVAEDSQLIRLTVLDKFRSVCDFTLMFKFLKPASQFRGVILSAVPVIWINFGIFIHTACYIDGGKQNGGEKQVASNFHQE